MTINSTLTENQILVGEALYAKAVNMILARAEQELLIFDQDLCHGDFCTLSNSILFQQFLSKNPNSRLTIVLQNTTYVKEKCPRIVNLLNVYGHKMTIHETNPSVKHVKDCFIVADSKHYVNRIHIDQARFKYATYDTEKVASLNIRFKELLENTHDTLAISKLGL